MDIYIKITAWILLIGIGICIILHPLIFGKPRPPYGLESWFSIVIEAVLLAPILGRILGWW
jgi:hypothetical protein